MIEKTSLEKSKKSYDLRPVASFFLTALMLIIVFLIGQISPFGSRSIMTSDLAAQYGPYLIGYRQALLSGGGFTYSAKLGMGSNAMGVFAYYLSSPINLLTLLFPASRIQEMVVMIIILKLSLSSATMTWLLDRKFKTKDRMTVVFGMMYPFCAFVMIYMFNIMWLDAFLLLPLLIMLTERFMESRRVWPILTLVLLVLFVSGYYMAYMVGIFSFLYLLSVMGYRGAFCKEKEKESLRTVGAFILSAVTAAMMSACILLPAGINTIVNKDYTVQPEMTIDPEFSLLKIFDQLVEKKVGNLSNNLPYIFTGVTVLLLCLLFFVHPKIKKSLKIGVGAAFSFLVLSFNFPLLNRAWHLFDDPNWFNFRYSYLFSFIMILVAYYSYTCMHELEKKHFAIAEGIVLAICIVSQSFGQMSEKDNTFFATVLISLLISILLYGKTVKEWPNAIRNLRSYSTQFLIAIIVVDVMLFTPLSYMPQIYSGEQNAEILPATVEQLQSLSKQVPEENGYRTELHNQWFSMIEPSNLQFYMDRHGISIFASMANKKTNHFLKQFGYELNYNYFSMRHDNMILPVDSLLGVRYLATADEELGELQKVAQAEESCLYENPYALPIAYLVETDAASFDGYALEKDEQNKDYFGFIEGWVSSLSGMDASGLFTTFNSNWEVVNGQRVSMRDGANLSLSADVINELNLETVPSKSKNIQLFLRNNSLAPLVIRSTITIREESPIYFLIPFPYLQNVAEIYVNGEYVDSCSESVYSRIYYLGSFDIGETVTVEIRGTENMFACYEPIFAYCHMNEFVPHQQKLLSTVRDMNVQDGHVTMEVSADTDKLLLTTIPYEDGWEAWVDGEKTELVSYQDAFLSIPLTSGTHTIELNFTPPGLKAGIACSCAGILCFIVLAFIMTRKKNNTEKVATEEKVSTDDIKNTTTNEEEKT